MDRPGTCEVPRLTMRPSGRGHRIASPRLSAPLAGRESSGTRISEQRMELRREAISAWVLTVGSRSTVIVPMKPGNLAPRDSDEGRAVPRVQTRRWETRRAL